MSDNVSANNHLKIDSFGKVYRKIPGQLHLKWRVKEVIGIAIINPRGLAAANKNVIVGK